MQKLTLSERGTLTTLLATASASGDMIPPFLIFKGNMLPDITQFPDGAKLNCSKSGYINQDIFLDFLQHFNDHRHHIDGKKCILYLDGHKSHITINAVDFCIENDIEMVCLPPHRSH